PGGTRRRPSQFPQTASRGAAGADHACPCPARDDDVSVGRQSSVVVPARTRAQSPDGGAVGEPVDLEALEQLVLRVSALVDVHPEIVELDLNPVLASAQERSSST